MGTNKPLAVVALIAVVATAFVTRTLMSEGEALEPAAARAVEDTGVSPVGAPVLGGEAPVAPVVEGKPAERARVDATAGAVGAARWVVSGAASRGLGKPYPAARVRLTLHSGFVAEGEADETTTIECDAEGRFVWALAPPAGPVVVEVEGALDEHTSYGETRRLLAGADAPDDLEVVFHPLDVTIAGTVTGAGGDPLEDALVRGRAGETHTDEQGAYLLRGSSTRRDEMVYAHAPGHAQLRATARTGGATEVVQVDFLLVPSFVVRGRVVDERDQPVEGATVRTFFTSRNLATSGPDGAFVLDHLDPRRERHHVYARKGGYVEASTVVEAASSIEELELELTFGARIEGHVIGPDGEPLPGAELYVGFSPSAYNRLDATAGVGGAFSFPNVAPGDQTLVTTYPGLAPDSRVLNVPSGERSLPAVVVRMRAGHFVGGTVRDEAGAALEGVWVSVQYQGEYTDQRTETDVDGRFRLDGLPADELSLEFYDSAIVRHEHAVSAVDKDDLEIVLRRAGKVGGLVVDAASGEPVDTFLVRFVEPVLEQGDQRVGGYGATWVREGKRFSGTAGLWDSTGEELVPGAVTGVEVRAEGYAPLHDYHVVVESSFEPGARVFALEPGAVVYGQVLEVDGAPVPGADVRVRAAGAPDRYRHERQYEAGLTVTEADGSFRIESAPTGSCQLHVTPPGRPAVLDGPFDVAPGGEVRRVVQLTAGGTVEGVVIDCDGHAAPEVEVVLHARAVPGVERYKEEGRTDGEGRFRFAGLPPGKYMVSRVIAGGDRTVYDLQTPCLVEEGATCEVRLEASGDATVAGTLSVDEGSVPEWVVVQLQFLETIDGPSVSGPRPVARGTIARGGRFEVRGVVPGRYRVHSFDWSSSSERSGFVEVSVEAGETAEVTLELVTTRR